MAAEPEALPPFIAELADFEWWEWLVIIAPDAGDQPADAGPLRLSSTVDLRPITTTLSAGWTLNQRSAAPSRAGRAHRLFLARSDAAWSARSCPADRAGRRQSHPGRMRIDDELAAQIGVDFTELSETLADLHAAGIVLGQLARRAGRGGWLAAGAGLPGRTRDRSAVAA